MFKLVNYEKYKTYKLKHNISNTCMLCNNTFNNTSSNASNHFTDYSIFY